ncbi:site-specific integrase [Alteriqipengyuania sp. NZ-12B]|uniref:Site-specific integrase n=1 Tax=Alteriqipengyuania abyssalis TaxID=2860200 RepID=A0ABS7PHD2_9SPHN|nr:site-specific integrase [Alteriqipengyuania abyssalis]MBY8338411.1 site-specific integrase [Alteriqipengyuania abyssalis]
MSRSLRTDSLTVANRLAAKCAIEAAAHFDDVRQSRSANLLYDLGHGGSMFSSISFEVLCDLYLADPTSSRTEKSLHAYKSALSVLIELIGPNTDARRIDRSICRDVMNVLTVLPTNARKRWPSMKLRDVAQKAVASGERPMSPANVNEYMSKLSTVLNWGMREEHCSANPAKGLRLPKQQAAKNRRHAFRPEQLKAIFAAPLYSGCVDDERGYAIAGDAHPRRSRFWVPLLSLFCGLRLNEACQLLVADAQVLGEVLCLSISANDDQKSIKTAASQRTIPVHPELIEIGFASHVADARARGDIRLFSEIKQDSFGMHSGRFSRWFSRFLITCGADASKTCFHSFRHSWRDALRNGRVDREVALALGGWTNASSFTAVGDTYGDGFDATILFEEIAKVRFPFLDLSHLKGLRV